MFTAFAVACVVLFLFLFVIWKSSDGLNLAIRMVFGAMLIWAVVCALMQFGFHR